MASPIEYHLKKIEGLTAEIKTLKVQRNALTVLKLLVFVVFIAGLLTLIDQQDGVEIVLVVASIAVFIYLAKKDTQVTYKYLLKQELQQASSLELEYLNRNFANLDTGEEFKTTKHLYSNDLDIFGNDSLFQAINRTVTLQGKSKLAHWLKNSKLNSQQIVETQKGVSEIKNKADWRLFFTATGKVNDIDKAPTHFEDWLKPGTLFNKKFLPFVYAGVGLNALIILLAVFKKVNIEIPFYTSGILLFIAFRFLKWVNKAHQKLDRFTKSFEQYYQLFNTIESVDFETEKLKSIQYKLFKEKHNASIAFQNVSKILNAFDQRSNILVTVLFNALFMRDIFLLVQLDTWKEKFNPFLLDWINQLAEVDALNSLANYHFNHPEFIYPTPNENTLIEATGLGHPAIPKSQRVCNDFELNENHRLDIVTGANMAGKSTFLRTVGINLVLAKCGAPVCAESFHFKPVALFTSMRTADDLADETSYFHAELLRLKQLVDLAKSEEQIIIILDEILKGTNSKDKLNGSKLFLLNLLDLPISGLIATHDLELGKLESEHPRHFRNTCFEIELDGNDISYDYKLKSGVSKNMNATLLMEQMNLI